MISGDYQYKAINEGHVIQRFWHTAKWLTIQNILCPELNDRVLDIGCGSGVISSKLKNRSRYVLAYDPNPDSILFASQRFRMDNLVFKVGTLQDLKTNEEKFDKAYCLEVIEHLPESSALDLLISMREALTPYGKALITTPNYLSAWPVVEWIADHSGLTAKMKEDQHITRFTRRRLEALLKRAGLHVITATSFCTIAPFASPLSWKLAERINSLELMSNFRFGTLLVYVVQRDA